MQPGLILTPNDRVGIGTVSPSEKLHVDGNTLVSGTLRGTSTAALMGNMTVGGNVLSSSDKSLKKDVQPLGDSLKEVLQWHPVSYEWKKREDREVGFIAQHMEQVFPEAVRDSSEKLKGISYFSLVAPVTGALQQLYMRFSKILNSVAQENQRIEKLNARLSDLVARQKALQQKNLILRQQLQALKSGTAVSGSP
jgi:septum formation inhibitor MinC